jgi:hypothetical protein
MKHFAIAIFIIVVSGFALTACTGKSDIKQPQNASISNAAAPANENSSVKKYDADDLRNQNSSSSNATNAVPRRGDADDRPIAGNSNTANGTRRDADDKRKGDLDDDDDQ